MSARGMLTVLGVPASKALAPPSASSFSHGPPQASAAPTPALASPAPPCSSSESASRALSFSASAASGSGASSGLGLRRLKQSHRSGGPGSSRGIRCPTSCSRRVATSAALGGMLGGMFKGQQKGERTRSIHANRGKQVLNAKPENVEREVDIAGQSGGNGAVTIATDTAGRGADIILGGTAEFMARLKLRENLMPRVVAPDSSEILSEGSNKMSKTKCWAVNPDLFPCEVLGEAQAQMDAAVEAAANAWGANALSPLEAEERLALACGNAPTEDPVISQLRGAYAALSQRYREPSSAFLVQDLIPSATGEFAMERGKLRSGAEKRIGLSEEQAVLQGGAPSMDSESLNSDLLRGTADTCDSAAASTGERDLLELMKTRWRRSGAGPRVRSILGFAGPALGIWLCSPLMSLIDTAVVGSSSSLELAALGPGTVVVDNMSFLFMFLSTATANLIATSMAEQKPKEASAHLRRLLLVALTCGVAMLAFSELCAPHLVAAMSGANTSIVPAATRYARIRGFAWPAVLLASVSQSACLALRDSWTPLICLSVASAINLGGDLLLCKGLGLGIAGAAWATAVSQYAACGLMLLTISREQRLELGMSVPSPGELLYFVSLAGPIFLSLVAKVGFYTLVTYMATSLGTVPLAAHQVVIGIFAVCAVCAEPLSQTAQAFLPRLCVGAHRDLPEAKALIQTLGAVALLLGVFEAVAAAVVSLLMPNVFTSNRAIASAMGSIVLPLGASLLLNPVVLVAEGVLLADRDVKFLALAMMANLAACGGLLLAAAHHKLGLLANWWIVVLFQLARIVQASRRILSPHGLLQKAQLHQT